MCMSICIANKLTLEQSSRYQRIDKTKTNNLSTTTKTNEPA